MKQQCPETAFEERYLQETIDAARKQLAQTRSLMEQAQEEFRDTQDEFWENTQHGILDLAGAADFEALVELSQSLAPARKLAADYQETAAKIKRLETLVKSPYFARIDFRFEGESEPEKIYIGRTALVENRSAKMYVYDWRSPVASVFYRFMTGAAYYDAPSGKITGEVEKKRQYEIKAGRLIYFFDTDRNINDEILKQLLSRNTTPRMRTIVETIQRDQDIVIRNMENDLLMIQGVAGSGKTSIALHRAAYLMYQGLQSRLSAANILILSPNAAFEQYISDVLPELGEENVISMVFEEMLRSFLKEKKVQSQNAFLETAVSGSAYGNLLKKSMAYKTSATFLRILDSFIAAIPSRMMQFRDLYLEETCVAKREELIDWMLRRPQLPLAERLCQLEARISDRLERMKGTGRGQRHLVLQELREMSRLDLCDLYRDLWTDERNFQSAGSDAGLAADIRGIRTCTLENLESESLHYDDAVAVLYLYLKIYGSRRYQNIQQVIIDEAQDYYPLQYEIFRILFPGAKYTILGDINQTLTKRETLSFYEQIRTILAKKNASLITLDKSFRCTDEILQFSLQFITPRPKIQRFNRSGDAVRVVASDTREACLAEIVQEVKTCRDKGLETVCLICRTEKSCLKLLSELQSRMEIRLIRDNGAESLQGTILLPAYLAKGLEFDAVLICDADRKSYSDEDDRKILYIECTRALHRLSLFCEGETIRF